MVGMKQLLFATIITLLATAAATADQQDPFDAFSFTQEITTDPEEDKGKSAEELIQEAYLLMSDERLLDARTKLLRALQRDPKQYKAHIMLASYYMVHVGHFRLALKYVKRALELFHEKFGQPPYEEVMERTEHAHLLYLHSQARLNLDNYQGALDLLDQYSALGYYSSWFAGSKAWILMKLGRLEEATRVAKLGVMAGAEPGRTLNMLGILLSMQHKREASLDVFQEAILYEMSLGELGQPATPLNNSGEVYKEIFKEDDAERAWLKAISLPDGCEHVLPSLNLALLYFEQQRFGEGKKIIDNFEACIAQYPLRNGEEHRALVHLARGRIEMHTGFIDKAIEHFEAAAQRQQWFGKIGTSGEDLQAAVLISLAQALKKKNNHIATTIPDDFTGRLKALKDRVYNWARAKWLFRNARKLLITKLNSFEDLYVRHTDSMIEYPTLGEFLRSFPTSVIEKRIALEGDKDSRERAKTYYSAYVTESNLPGSASASALKSLEQAVAKTRDRYDRTLRLHLMTQKLAMLKPNNAEYLKLAESIFEINRAQLRNAGLPLPVDLKSVPSNIRPLLESVNFIHNESATLSVVAQTNTESEFILVLRTKESGKVLARSAGPSDWVSVNNLAQLTFSESI